MIVVIVVVVIVFTLKAAASDASLLKSDTLSPHPTHTTPHSSDTHDTAEDDGCDIAVVDGVDDDDAALAEFDMARGGKNIC